MTISSASGSTGILRVGYGDKLDECELSGESTTIVLNISLNENNNKIELNSDVASLLVEGDARDLNIHFYELNSYYGDYVQRMIN